MKRLGSHEVIRRTLPVEFGLVIVTMAMLWPLALFHIGVTYSFFPLISFSFIFNYLVECDSQRNNNEKNSDGEICQIY